MNERTNCTACLHRRAITSMMPSYTVCHYLLDTGKPRGCPPEQCNHWRPQPKNTHQWLALLEALNRGDKLGE
ncbi:MAG: hypothetical protein RR461_05825 [Angelakisella sp.]